MRIPDPERFSKAAVAGVEERLRSLESDCGELEESEKRLKTELAAEQGHGIAVQDQIQTLGRFDQRSPGAKRVLSYRPVMDLAGRIKSQANAGVNR